MLTKIDYCGPFVYETVNGVRSLKYLITEEGRVVKSGTNWIWEYNQTDHLGDVRTVVRRNATTGLAELVQDNHYFPFGMLMSDISTSSTDNRFRYNGKEYQNDLNLEWYDYGARFYDPALARWHSVDPLAEKYYSMSPYCYVGNNPISRFDPNGKEWDTEKDNEKAKQLQEQLRTQISNLNNSNATLDKKISEAKEKGNEKRVNNLENRKENNNNQIGDLKKGIDEIQYLGDTHNYTFTFTPVNSDNNHVTLMKDGEKPLLSIEYSTNALAMHESRHAFQYITEGKSSGRMVFDRDTKYLAYTSENSTVYYETRAHQLQYSFSNSSLPINASSFFDINKDWLKSIPGNIYKIK